MLPHPTFAVPAIHPATFAGHTPGHINCPACDERRSRIVDRQTLGRLPFTAAAAAWLQERGADLAPKTRKNYDDYIKALTPFFGELPLHAVHIGHLEAYREERSAAAGASSINHELNTLKQVLERAGLWSEIGKFYKPMRLPKPTVGKALEPEDERRLFRIAASRPRWRVAYLCSIVTATTTAGPKEITHLHVNDIDLGTRAGAPLGTVRIRDGLKNGYRERVIPMNESSRWACTELLRRYHGLARRRKVTPNGEHYLLGGRKRAGGHDPWKPMGSWRKAWEALRAAASMPDLRMYDLRHHAITRLMEDPDVSEQTVEEMAGHAMSSTMKKRYSHIRMRPKSEAAARLEVPLPDRTATPTEVKKMAAAAGTRNAGAPS